MRENPQESLRSQDVWGKMKPSYEIDLAARKFGKVYSDLEYAKSAYALIMSSENYNELRKTLEMQVDEVLGAARRRFEEDSQRFGRYLSDGRRGSARKLLSDMKDSFGAIPDFSTRLKQLDDRL